jgi:hypothetical protein
MGTGKRLAELKSEEKVAKNAPPTFPPVENHLHTQATLASLDCRIDPFCGCVALSGERWVDSSSITTLSIDIFG